MFLKNTSIENKINLKMEWNQPNLFRLSPFWPIVLHGLACPQLSSLNFFRRAGIVKLYLKIKMQSSRNYFKLRKIFTDPYEIWTVSCI